MKKKILLLGVIMILVFIMFLGLKGWTDLVVPNLGRLANYSLPGLIVFSFLAGGVSFFSPCSFALFPGYVAFYLGSEEEKKQNPAKLGIMASLGVVSFFMLLSAVIIFIGTGIAKYLRFLAPIIGFILILMGLILFMGYSIKSGVVQKVFDKLKSKERRSNRNQFLFGSAYGAVSLGCTLPLLFAMIIVPITAGKILNVFISIVVYSFAMSMLMIVVTYLVAWSENRIIKKLVNSTATIKKLSGLALIVIGAYLLYSNLAYGMVG